MEEYFVPFHLSLKLKELGCDVKTIAYYDMEGLFYPMGNVMSPTKMYFGAFIPKYQYKEDLEPLVSAPLWDQAFDYLKDKTNVQGFVKKTYLSALDETIYIPYSYKAITNKKKIHNGLSTIYEAKAQLLNHIRETVKNEQTN